MLHTKNAIYVSFVFVFVCLSVCCWVFFVWFFGGFFLGGGVWGWGNWMPILFYLQTSKEPHQTAYEKPIQTPAATEYEMPVSIYTNGGNGYGKPAVEFWASNINTSAVYYTIPIQLQWNDVQIYK